MVVPAANAPVPEVTETYIPTAKPVVLPTVIVVVLLVAPEAEVYVVGAVKLSKVAEEVPLFKVTPVELLKLVKVALLQSKVASDEPLKVMFTPEALTTVPPVPAVALKLSDPLLVKLPPTIRAWVVTVEVLPAAADLKIAPELIVTSLEVVNVLAVVSYCKTPEVPPPTVNVPTVGLISIVTVAPSAMVTKSPIVGTTPPTQVEVALHKPPVDVEETGPGALVA
jgi:hypothetical protein